MLIHKIFEEQVRKTPYKPAVIFEKESISYSELNQKANRLSHFLQSTGVKLETLVAISMNRSIDLIIAILGILKAGGAYVPIDPALPKDRFEFILNDTGNPLLLTTHHLQTQYRHYHKVITIDEIWAQSTELTAVNPDSKVKECNLAYVIYTSGSSGTSKGVLIEHKGIPNLAIAQAELFKITSDSKVLQFASISFDASVSEWATTLSQGATLCIPNIGHLSVADALSQALENHDYTVATIPPSVLSILPEKLIAPLKTLVVAGEACNEELIQKWKNKLRLINAYGPTEYTVCTTTFVYENNNNSHNIIGKPLPYTNLYILDENLKPVANGEEEELCIEGIGQARGYLNRPELTANKFISNPIHQNGPLIYRTGDKVCLLPDGNLKYLGRLDDQIKINGYRIEVNEIEQTIKQLPWIQNAVVLSRVQSSGNKQLITFFIPCGTQNSVAGREGMHNEKMTVVIKQHLETCLPSYLIPHLIIPVETFPLTIQGKLDRGKLFEQCKLITKRVSFSPHQQVIAKIWEQVLEIDIPSSAVSFFDLGGGSLLLYTLQERLQHYFQMKFELSDFFLYPTIESFSNFVLQEQTNSNRKEQNKKCHAKISHLDRINASRYLRLKA